MSCNGDQRPKARPVGVDDPNLQRRTVKMRRMKRQYIWQTRGQIQRSSCSVPSQSFRVILTIGGLFTPAGGPSGPSHRLHITYSRLYRQVSSSAAEIKCKFIFYKTRICYNNKIPVGSKRYALVEDNYYLIPTFNQATTNSFIDGVWASRQLE